jgi:2-polyprenyl-6-methoxyphenol hydroxylase-like FAD-dependent oxidoreductase
MVDEVVQTQVAVVGAGPVGLMLAGELRLGGADVIVLERLGRPTTESRASTLHARTMEMLDSRDLLAHAAEAPSDVTGHFGGIPLHFTLPSPYAGQWKVPQTDTEAFLAEWAASLGADIRRGHDVQALCQDDDQVKVSAVGAGRTLEVRADYVVGCDGEGSIMRRLAGFAFPGEDSRRELLRGDVDGIEIPNRRFQRLAGGLAIAARRGDGVTRVMVHEFGTAAGDRSRAPEFTELADAWRRVTGEDITGGTPLWVNSFGDASRQAACYRNGRVLLAGDAAHIQMPIGGQALNLGLADAFNLGWKLALQVSGQAPSGLLDSYHAERHPVGERVLTNIRAQAHLLLGGHEVDPLREVFGELAGLDCVRQHLAGMISGLDVRYGAGSGDHPLLGRAVPDVPLATDMGLVTTAALLRPGRGVLLDLSGDADAGTHMFALVRGWTDRVTAVPAQRPADGPLADAGALLLRPDGCVAWVGAAGTGLLTALDRWFGEPRPRRT